MIVLYLFNVDKQYFQINFRFYLSKFYQIYGLLNKKKARK